MGSYTPKEIRTRAVLSFIVPFMTVLSAAEETRNMLGAFGCLLLVAVVAGLISWRNYLDQSSGKGTDTLNNQPPTEVVAKEPLPVTETNPEAGSDSMDELADKVLAKLKAQHQNKKQEAEPVEEMQHLETPADH